MITFDAVSKSYGKRTVLSDVSFTINPGEFVCVTGPSGAGKTTLVHLFIRAEVPSSGKVLVDGKDVATLPRSILQLYRRRTGVVFQDYKLLADRTVGQNIAFAMEACGDSSADIAKRVPAMLERVGLHGHQDSYPNELSGGEKARATLARALVHNPMIVIADEPTGNIDPQQSMEILNLLKEVHADGVTVILATHDMDLVDALQTRVLRIEDGKLVRDAVGGYEKGKAQSASGKDEEHKIFEKPVAKSTGSKASKSSSKSGKIKPISI